MSATFIKKLKKDALLCLGGTLSIFFIGYMIPLFKHTLYWWFASADFKHPLVILFLSLLLGGFSLSQFKTDSSSLSDNIKLKNVYEKSMFIIHSLVGFLFLSLFVTGIEHLFYGQIYSTKFTDYSRGSLTEFPDDFLSWRKNNPKSDANDIIKGINRYDYTTPIVLVSEKPLIWQETLTLNQEECLKALKSDTFKQFDVYSVNGHAVEDDQCTNYLENDIVIQKKQ
jgi:hypothetical protein